MSRLDAAKELGEHAKKWRWMLKWIARATVWEFQLAGIRFCRQRS